VDETNFYFEKNFILYFRKYIANGVVRVPSVAPEETTEVFKQPDDEIPTRKY